MKRRGPRTKPLHSRDEIQIHGFARKRYPPLERHSRLLNVSCAEVRRQPMGEANAAVQASAPIVPALVASTSTVDV
jgi:hypothetical protein